MTTGQIMMKLREIEAELDAVWEPALFMGGPNLKHFTSAQALLRSLIEQMLADEARAKAAHTMGELPYDGQTVKE